MKVLILGSGVMAMGIARQLTQIYDVVVLSRHLDPTFIDFQVATDLDETLSHDYSAVISCVTGDERSRELWLDERMYGLLRRVRPLVVELSTLSASWIGEWHQHMESLGVIAIESPVTGSRSGAEAGTLSSFFYSKNQSRLANEIFVRFTNRIYRFSAPGNPTRFKLIYNSWGAALLTTLGPHVALLSEHLTDDFDLASRIVRSDGWMAPLVASKWDRRLDDYFENPDFRLAHMVKDLNYLREILDNGDSYAHHVREAYETLLSPSTANLDFSVISRLSRDHESSPRRADATD